MGGIHMIDYDDLSKEQKYIVDYNPPQHQLITGVAGSGKTVLAILKAKRILETEPSAKILFLTYHNSLLQYIQNELQGILAKTYHQFIHNYLYPYEWQQICGSENGREKFIREAIQCVVPFDSPYFKKYYVFEHEINLIDNLGLTKLQYKTGESTTRYDGLYVSNYDKDMFYSVYEKYKEIIKHNNYVYDWPETSHKLLDILRHAPSELKIQPKQFDYIFIDEIQNFSLTMFLSLKYFLKNSTYGMIVFGDNSQRSYGYRNSIEALTKQFSCVFPPLAINYRTPLHVADFIKDITRTPYWSKNGQLVIFRNLEHTNFKPTLCRFIAPPKRYDSLYVAALYLIQSYFAYVRNKKICVAFRHVAEAKSFSSWLLFEGYPNQNLSEKDATYDYHHDFYVSTIHAMSGLEFDVLILVNFTEDEYADIEEEQQYKDLSNLLYMAVSRVKQNVVFLHPKESAVVCVFPINDANYEIKELSEWEVDRLCKIRDNIRNGW